VLLQPYSRQKIIQVEYLAINMPNNSGATMPPIAVPMA